MTAPQEKKKLSCLALVFAALFLCMFRLQLDCFANLYGIAYTGIGKVRYGEAPTANIMAHFDLVLALLPTLALAKLGMVWHQQPIPWLILIWYLHYCLLFTYAFPMATILHYLFASCMLETYTSCMAASFDKLCSAEIVEQCYHVLCFSTSTRQTNTQTNVSVTHCAHE